MICNGVFRFCNGVKVGTHWKWNRGNGFTVGELDHENRNIGKSRICYSLLRTERRHGYPIVLALYAG
jgi:hypothetical protein